MKNQIAKWGSACWKCKLCHDAPSFFKALLICAKHSTPHLLKTLWHSVWGIDSLLSGSLSLCSAFCVLQRRHLEWPFIQAAEACRKHNRVFRWHIRGLTAVLVSQKQQDSQSRTRMTSSKKNYSMISTCNQWCEHWAERMRISQIWPQRMLYTKPFWQLSMSQSVLV